MIYITTRLGRLYSTVQWAASTVCFCKLTRPARSEEAAQAETFRKQGAVLAEALAPRFDAAIASASAAGAANAAASSAFPPAPPAPGGALRLPPRPPLQPRRHRGLSRQSSLRC